MNVSGSEPDMGLLETKVGEGVGELDFGGSKYNMWKRNRKGKQGGGVMLLCFLVNRWFGKS